MQITLTLNGIRVSEEIAPDMLLIDFVRAHGCKSVKRGCETANCGLCTVFLDEKPVLSCSVLAARVWGVATASRPMPAVKRTAPSFTFTSSFLSHEARHTAASVLNMTIVFFDFI